VWVWVGVMARGAGGARWTPPAPLVIRYRAGIGACAGSVRFSCESKPLRGDAT
jgi:hypothetical protein